MTTIIATAALLLASLLGLTDGVHATDSTQDPPPCIVQGGTGTCG